MYTQIHAHAHTQKGRHKLRFHKSYSPKFVRNLGLLTCHGFLNSYYDWSSSGSETLYSAHWQRVSIRELSRSTVTYLYEQQVLPCLVWLCIEQDYSYYFYDACLWVFLDTAYAWASIVILHDRILLQQLTIYNLSAMIKSCMRRCYTA